MKRTALEKAFDLIAEGRVRGLEADRRRMKAIVIGDSGVYRVTVEVVNDRFVRSCSCPNAGFGRPKCSHANAVEVVFRQFLGMMKKENDR